MQSQIIKHALEGIQTHSLLCRSATLLCGIYFRNHVEAFSNADWGGAISGTIRAKGISNILSFKPWFLGSKSTNGAENQSVVDTIVKLEWIKEIMKELNFQPKKSNDCLV